MPDDQLAELERLVALDEAVTPDRLMHHLDPRQWDRPAHIRFIGDVLARVGRGGKRIIVECSVRHGKSFTASWALPVWYLNHYPANMIGFATYQANFSARWGRKVRNTIEQNSHRLNVKIAGDASAAHSWETTAGGGMHTAGVGGEFTGRGFNLLLIDDPIKNYEEAASEVYREKVWDWWQSTALTRVEPNGSVVITMARWNQDDLVGRLLADAAEGGEPWDVVRLPAIAEDDDAMGREPGEPLWPERYDAAALGEIKRGVGSYAWSSLYQQRPSPAGGNLFKRKWFGRFRVDGDEYVLIGDKGAPDRRVKADYLFATVDTGLSDRKTADPTAIAMWAVVEKNKLLLLEITTKRQQMPETERDIIAAYHTPGVKYVGVEDAMAGRAFCDRLDRLGITVKRLKAETSKEARSAVAQILAENGRMYLPERVGWKEDYLQELEMFPNGRHDDQVDVTSYAAKCIDTRGQPAKQETLRGMY